jgi:hypothetical protein
VTSPPVTTIVSFVTSPAAASGTVPPLALPGTPAPQSTTNAPK